MTNVKLGRWLLVALAIVRLAFAAPVVSAHGNDTTADDAPTDNTTADEWATWMEAQMTDHMGPCSVEWMESHMGVTVDEMAQDMADEEYHDGADDESHGGITDGLIRVSVVLENVADLRAGINQALTTALQS